MSERRTGGATPAAGASPPTPSASPGPTTDVAGGQFSLSYMTPEEEQKWADKDAPPPTGTSSPPPEGAHDVADYRVLSLAPSVELTNNYPVPYNIWAKADDDLLFSPNVFYRGTKAMRLSSRISKNYGDEPANGKKGVVSSANQGMAAPITSSSIVRINGSWAIRHGDRFEMDKASIDGPGNTIGEGRLVRDTQPREAPKDERSWWRKATDAAGQWIADHPRTMGAAQAAGGVGEAIGSAALIVGGTAADATGAAAVVGVPAQALGWAGLVNSADNISTGLRQLWYGSWQRTVGQQAAGAAAGALGASPETAQGVENVVGMGQAVLGGAAGMGGAISRAGRGATLGGEAADLAKGEAAVAKTVAQEGAEAGTMIAKAEQAATAGGNGVRVTKNAYEYVLDKLGRTVRAKGKLKLNKAPRDAAAQRAAGGADRRSTDQGGHLIGSRFDGPSDALNTVAQDQNLNQGAWKAMENSWARALEQGQEVVVDIQPKYIGDSLRPSSFVVDYTIDGVPKRAIFDNAVGQVFGR